MLQENRTGGTAVNIAARLEAFSEPGGVCLSAAVFEQVKRSIAASYEPVGEQRFKNIRDPVSVYMIRAASCSAWVGMPALPRRTVPETTASKQAKQLLRRALTFRLSAFRARAPLRGEVRDRFIERLRIAGLPE